MSWFRGANWRSMDAGPGRLPHSARPYVPSDSTGNMEAMMVEMFLNEIQREIDRIEEEQEKRRQDMLKATKTPDYSWLMDWKLKSKKHLGFRDCSAIELLCAKMRTNEWGQLIREWRSRVRYVESRDDVVGLFRTVVEEIVASRNVVHQVDEFNDPALDFSIWRVRQQQQSPFPQADIPPRSLSVAELSATDLYPREYNEAPDIV